MTRYNLFFWRKQKISRDCSKIVRLKANKMMVLKVQPLSKALEHL